MTHKFKHVVALATFAALSAVAGSAYAAPKNVGKVVGYTVNNDNRGGDVYVYVDGEKCANGNTYQLDKQTSTNFDNALSTVTAAFLSGRPVVLDVDDACVIRAIRLGTQG